MNLFVEKVKTIPLSITRSLLICTLLFFVFSLFITIGDQVPTGQEFTSNFTESEALYYRLIYPIGYFAIVTFLYWPVWFGAVILLSFILSFFFSKKIENTFQKTLLIALKNAILSIPVGIVFTIIVLAIGFLGLLLLQTMLKMIGI